MILRHGVSTRERLAQRSASSVITAHAVDAAAGRSRGGTDVDVLKWCAVGVNRGTCEKLSDRRRAAVDVAADEVRIVNL